MHHIEDRHLHLEVLPLVDVIHALRAVVSLGHHAHLHLGHLHAVALSEHRAEVVVARESAVGRDEEVAQIGGAVDVAGHGSDRIHKLTHFADGVADEHRHEVVAGLHAVDHTGRDGVDVLQHRRILYAVDIVGDDGLHLRRGEAGGELTGLLGVEASDGQIAEAFERHFLRMARAADYEHVAARHPAHLLEIVGDDHVAVRHYAFHGRDDVLLRDVDAELAYLRKEIRGRHRHYEGVGVGRHLVDVGGEVNPVGVEAYVGQIGWVVAVFPEFLYLVVAAEIPSDAVAVLKQKLGDGCRPASASENGYF